MIEELESKIEEFRSVLEVLPTKTVDQRKKRDKIINDAEKDALDMMDLVEDEIDVRLAKFDIYKPNLVIDELKKELKKCSILKEWNIYNTPYEKMHLDYYLHVLHKFYNEDLDGINTVIRKILDAFKTVGVNITKVYFDNSNNIRILPICFFKCFN